MKKIFNNKNLLILILIIFIFIIANMIKSKTNVRKLEDNSILINKKIESLEQIPKELVEIESFEFLSKENVGDFVNYNFLVKKELKTNEEITKVALEVKNKYCNTEKCNVVSLWNNSRSFELYKDERTTNEVPSWINKNWIFICEGLICDYNIYVEDLIIYPLLDEKYRELGGKLKRPH